MAKRQYTWDEFTRKRERYRKAAQGLLAHGYNDAPLPYISTQKELKQLGYTAKEAIQAYGKLFRYYSTAESLRNLGKKSTEKLLKAFGKSPIRFYQVQETTKQKNGKTLKSIKTSGTEMLTKPEKEIAPQPPDLTTGPGADEYYTEYTEAPPEALPTDITYTGEEPPESDDYTSYTEGEEGFPEPVTYTTGADDYGSTTSTEEDRPEYTDEFPSEKDIRMAHTRDLLSSNEFGGIIESAIKDFADEKGIPAESVWDDFIFNPENERDLETFDIIYTRYREDSAQVLPSVVQNLIKNLYGGEMPGKYRFYLIDAVEHFNETYFDFD